MNVVLLVFIMTIADHKPPDRPKFFTMYRTEKQCYEAADRYMALNGQINMLVNARCVDARNPDLIPYLYDIPEVSLQDANNFLPQEEI